MTITTNKNLGIAASILTVLALIFSFSTLGQTTNPLPSLLGFSLGLGIIGSAFSLIGFILFLVTMYGFSKDYQTPNIFNYILYGLIAAIVAGVITIVIVVALVFTNLSAIITTIPPNNSTQFLQDYFQSLVPYFLGISFIGLIPAIFNMLAFNKLADKSSVRLFKTVGQLGVAAAAVNIALWFIGVAFFYTDVLALSNITTFSTVGSAVSLAAWIIAAKAYYSIPLPPNEAPWSPPTPTSTVPTATSQVKYCPYCGTANTSDAEFCVHCGKKQ